MGKAPYVLALVNATTQQRKNATTQERISEGIAFPRYRVLALRSVVSPLFLASDDAGWMTGETIPIDGGRHLTCLR
jgi:NAD(P)-dependent dehydrogenase (short-subunit alcohol dehydrogenase family)